MAGGPVPIDRRSREPSPSADVAGVSPFPDQMWQGIEPFPGADVAGVSPVPAKMPWKAYPSPSTVAPRTEILRS